MNPFVTYDAVGYARCDICERNADFLTVDETVGLHACEHCEVALKFAHCLIEAAMEHGGPRHPRATERHDNH